MKLFKRLSRGQPDTLSRENKNEKIAALGFKLLDCRGWHGGTYAQRRYFLERGNETLGPFHTFSEAHDAAKANAS